MTVLKVAAPLLLTGNLPNTDAYWHYEYTFNIDENLQGGLSHLIIEVSDDLEYGDIENPSPSIEGDDPKWYNPELFDLCRWNGY